MALKCGIIGITNTGKTTIFNCFSNKKAQSTSFAFSTSKSNMGIIEVPDERLEKINNIIHSAKVTPTTVEILDIPGLAKGASKGEGIGNKFLADIDRCDALIHVLRCFDDENLPHVEGSVNPLRDKEIIDLELQVRDLESIEKRIQRVEKVAKSGDKDSKKILHVLNTYKEHLENFKPAISAPVEETDKKLVSDLFLLTMKPVMFVCNVDEESAVTGNKYVDDFKEFVKEENTEVLVIAGELEAEIAELDDPEDKKEFLLDAGLEEPGVNKLIRSAYKLLNLTTFFTAGPKEVRAWTVRTGSTAPQAAGVIHSDLERGFIRAEVIKYEDFISLGSEHACKEAGKLAVEGKNYVVRDGDMLFIRFNV